MRISDWSSDVGSSDLRTLARGRICSARHAGLGTVDIILEHVVEETHHIFDEALLVLPLIPGFEVQGREAAHRGAIVAEMILAGGQRDLAAQVRGGNFERSEERRGGKECVSTVRSGWSPENRKK